MALDADPPTRTRVAARIGSGETRAKAIVSTNRSALEIAWREIASSGRAREVFQRAFVDLDLEREPTAAHFALAQMMRAGVVEYVVSYNWDTALERAFEHLYGVPIPAQSLIKPHGDANQPELPWVLPHEDGVVPDEARAALGRLSLSHPRVFMIIGYSGSDRTVVRELIEPYEQSWPVYRVGPFFEGPEALTGTAEEVLPALCADLQLDIGLRHWRNVTFRQQRSFTAALLGYRLGPNDVDSCPKLPGFKSLTRRARGAKFVAVTGPSGSGKSVTAFQAARELNREGWSILELLNPGTASDSAVREFIAHPGPVLAVVDDAQSINTSVVRDFERAVSEDHAVILCATSWQAPIEQVSIAARAAVETLAEFCLTNSASLTELVANLDDRVGFGLFREQIDARIRAARKAEFPWQLMQTLSGGDRRLREELHELQSDDHIVLLGLVALHQILSLDEGIDPLELSARASSAGLSDNFLVSGLIDLRQRRLLFERNGRIRLPHIRFAISALNEVFKRPRDGAAPALLEAARATLLNDDTSDLGRLWLVDAVRNDALRYTHLLVDSDVRNLLLQRMFDSAPDNRGLRAELLWAAQWGHNPLPDSAWEEIGERMPQWVLEATDDSAYGIHWLINGLRGHSKDLHRRASITVGLDRLITRMLQVGTGKYVAAWDGLITELCQVGWNRLRELSAAVGRNIELSEYEAWVTREAPASDSLHGWASLAQTLWHLPASFSETVVRAIQPKLVETFETAPIEAHRAIFDWFFGFLQLLTDSDSEAELDEAQREVRATYCGLMSGWIDAVDWSKVGRSLSDCHPSDMHNFGMLAYLLHKVDQGKLDQMCHSVDPDAFCSLPPSYWQEGLWRDRDFVVVLSASTDMEPARSILRSHRGEISTIALWAIPVVPEIAVALAPVQVQFGHPSYSFHWQECAEAINALIAADRVATKAIFDANRELLLKQLTDASDYAAEGFEQFVQAVDALDADLLGELLADLNMAAAGPIWAQRLADASDGAKIVRTMIRRMGIDETSFMNAYTEELPSSTEPAGDPETTR